MIYRISEKRLYEYMVKYLDRWLEHHFIQTPGDFILVSEKTSRAEDADWIDIMEYDYSDGRLWINQSFLQSFADLFAHDKEDASSFLKDWFENKFKVEIKFTQS